MKKENIKKLKEAYAKAELLISEIDTAQFVTKDENERKAKVTELYD